MMFLYNYVTQKFDRRFGMPSGDDEALMYLPQYPTISALYLARRELGDSVVDAMATTLRAILECEVGA
jgi:hypothetical protein